MAVWEGERPRSDEEAAETCQALYEQYIVREFPIEVTPKIREFVEALLATFPDL
jgi:hypothetical protein